MKKNSKKIILSAALSAALLCTAGGLRFLTEPDATYAIASAEELSEFTMLETAAVRKTTPNGLRFTVNVGNVVKEKVKDLSDVTYGTLLMPEDKLNGAELTLSTSNVLNVTTQNWSKDGASYQAVLVGQKNSDGAYVDLPESYFNRPIVARGYVTGSKDGATYTYYTENTATRSIAYVANAAIAAGESSTLLNTIASKTDYTWSTNVTLSTVGDSTILYNASYDNAAYALLVGGIPATGAEYTVTSGSDVVEVENGKIVAKKAGTATVSATYNGNTQTISVSVTDSASLASDYTLLVPSGTLALEYSDPIKYAATDFQKLFKEATGVELKIQEETGAETTDGKYISLGDTKLAEKTTITISSAKKTASALREVGNTFFVKGNTDDGTLYGVYEWLGSLLGYEYYAKDTYSLTSNAAKLIENVANVADDDYVPSIEYSISTGSDINKDDNLLNRYRMNTWYGDLLIINKTQLHNTFAILPPFSDKNTTEGNYKEHPEWYTSKQGLVFDGTLEDTDEYGRKSPYELCFTAHGDSDEYEAMTTAAAKAYTDALASDKTTTKASLSIRDNVVYCQCETCNGYKNKTDTAIKFVNDVCAKIRAWLQEQNDPRKDTFRMVFLAYHYTNSAPSEGTKLDPYVDVWFADSFAVYTLPLNDANAASKTKTTYDNLQAWKDILDADNNKTNGVRNNNLLIWTYNANMKELLAPYDSFNSMRVNYGLFADVGANSVYNFTASAMSGWTSLKKYLASQLAWNANPDDTTWNGWIDNFFTNAYGDGAGQMKAWFEAYQTYAEGISDKFNINSKVEDTTTASIYLNVADSEFFTKEALEAWLGYANAAIAKLDKNDQNYQTYYNNIALERLSPVYLLLEIYGEDLSDTDKTAYAAIICGEVQKLGVKEVRLDTSISEITEKYDAMLTTTGTLVLEKGESLSASAVFGEDSSEAISTVQVNGTDVYADGKLSLTETGVYKAIITGANGTQKILELHYADKVIKTFKDLEAVMYGGSNDASKNISGYYVLGNDIDGKGATITLGYGVGWSAGVGFVGTFDGLEHTISNFSSNTNGNGIFGSLGKSTVQNVTFKGVTLTDGGVLLARCMYNTQIINVNVEFASIHENAVGLLQKNGMGGETTWTNVTLDAGENVVPNLLGTNVNLTENYPVRFENVTIKAAGVTKIGVNSEEVDITSYPDGISFTKVEVKAQETITTKLAADSETGLIVTNDHIKANDEITVTVNGTTLSATANTDGTVTVTGFSGLTAGTTYTVVLETSTYKLTCTDVVYADKVIREFKDLEAEMYVGSNDASKNISGYYVLGNDIDGNGMTIKLGYGVGWNAGQGFVGTFDGLGHTISNFSSNEDGNGIFGSLGKSTVQNISFKGVTLAKANSVLLARHMYDTKISNVTVEFASIHENASGLLQKNGMGGETTWTNVTLDAGENVVPNLLGTGVNLTTSSIKFVDVTIKAAGVTKIGVNSESTEITSYPDGISFTQVAVKEQETITTKLAADSTTGLIVTNDHIKANDEITVTVNGTTLSATASADGTVTVTGFSELTAGTTYTVVLETSAYKLTCEDVIYADKVIRTIADLSTVQPADDSATVTGYYALAGNIDGGGSTLAQPGRSWNNDKGFRGTFDGRGYTISNFNTNDRGVFGNVALNAVIKDVTLNIKECGSNAIAYAIRYATMTNVTVKVESVSNATTYLFLAEIRNSTLTNVSISYAESVVFSNDGYALCRVQSDSTFTKVSITTNIQNQNKIIKDVTELPSGVTVTTSGEEE